MKLETRTFISLPAETVKQFYLNQFHYLEMRVRESDSQTLIIHPIIPFLVADHPLAFCRRIEITITPVSDTETKIHLMAWIDSFLIFLAGFLFSIIVLLTTLAHWILNSSWIDTCLSFGSIYLMIVGGGVIGGYLVKWAVQRFLRQMEDKIKSLTLLKG